MKERRESQDQYDLKVVRESRRDHQATAEIGEIGEIT